MKLSASRPTLWLTPEVDQRIRHWVEIAAGEMSCLGMVDLVDGGFLVSEVFLLLQTCGSAETEMDHGAVARLLAELDAAGEDVSRLRFWHHSHADMKTFFSSTDTATIRSLANDDWTISLVSNKAGDQQARLDLWHPTTVTLDELPVRIHHADLGLRDECERLFRERVTEAPPMALVTGAIGSAHFRRFLDERIDRVSLRDRFPGLGWEDIDGVLSSPETGEGSFDVGP